MKLLSLLTLLALTACSSSGTESTPQNDAPQSLNSSPYMFMQLYVANDKALPWVSVQAMNKGTEVVPVECDFDVIGASNRVAAVSFNVDMSIGDTSGNQSGSVNSDVHFIDVGERIVGFAWVCSITPHSTGETNLYNGDVSGFLSGNEYYDVGR